MTELEIALRAKVGVIWIRTDEEVRIERIVLETCLSQKYEVYTWAISTQLTDLKGDVVDANIRDASAAITHILKTNQRAAYLFRDLSPVLTDPVIIRRLKDLARKMPTRPVDEAIQLIIIDSKEPPAGLSAVTIDWPLPDRDDITTILDNLVASLGPELEDARDELEEPSAKEAVIDAAIGLTAEQISIALAKSLVVTKRFSPAMVSAEKEQAVKGSGLEWYPALEEGMDGVGGMEALKAWLAQRHAGFLPEGKQAGLPAPKGILLLGIPGCGKSHTAKSVATSWGIPLLKLDMGSMFNKWVGESERQVRTALKQAESVAPCVLWIDEIEKSGAASSDGGVTQRVLGTFLTWLQDRSDGVFVVATANDVSCMPPELLRAGRWDDIFWVDLPNVVERTQIVDVLKGRFQNCEKINAAAVAKKSNGFTGAELEAAIKAATYAAFEDGGQVKTQHVVTEIKSMVPLSKSMAERINALRDWAKGRARCATPQEDTAANGPIKGGSAAIEVN